MKNTSKLFVSVDMNSDSLVRKLEAISKHAQALADELKKIDQSICPECGGQLGEETLYADGGAYCKNVYCADCDYVECESND